MWIEGLSCCGAEGRLRCVGKGVNALRLSGGDVGREEPAEPGRLGVKGRRFDSRTDAGRLATGLTLPDPSGFWADGRGPSLILGL